MNESRAPEDMRAHLAVEVMGYWASTETDTRHAMYYDPKQYDPNFASDEQVAVCRVADWKPEEDISQAFMVLEKFEWWEIDKAGPYGMHSVVLGRIKTVTEKSLALAICIAACRATGLQE